MSIKRLLLLLVFVLAAGLPACDCDSGYITSPEADATATDTPPPLEAVE